MKLFPNSFFYLLNMFLSTRRYITCEEEFCRFCSLLYPHLLTHEGITDSLLHKELEGRKEGKREDEKGERRERRREGEKKGRRERRREERRNE